MISNRRGGGVIGWLARVCIVLAAMAAVGGAALGVYVYGHFAQGLPEILTVHDYRPATITRFRSDDGQVVAEFADERRAVIPLESMQRHTLEAFLAAEDKRFFAHGGIDYRATLRAVLKNYQAGRTTQGASTITQQVCKNLVGRERSYVRKVREAILARRTEHRLTKLDILYLYLNDVYLGQGAYGVEAASRTYFGKAASALTLAESAMLAGLPPQPSRLNPIRDLEGAKRRQRYVLRRMVEEAFISDTQARLAGESVLKIHPPQTAIAADVAPYFTEHVRKRLAREYGKDVLLRDGFQVETTVSTRRQDSARKRLTEGLGALGRRQGYLGPVARLDGGEWDAFIEKAVRHYAGPDTLEAHRLYFGLVDKVERRNALIRVGQLEAHLPLRRGASWAKAYDGDSRSNMGRARDLRKVLSPGDVVMVSLAEGKGPEGRPVLKLRQVPPVQGAMMSLEHRTGYVSSVVGGFDFDQSEYNRAFQGCRQPGSIFKPLVYGLALDTDLTLASLLEDTPITVYDSKEGYFWKPGNFGGNYRGHVLLRDAFSKSMNIPAIRVIRRVGAENAVRWAKSLGVTTPLYPDQSLVLGSSCVYPWDMVKVYGTFASRGRDMRPVFVKRVIDRAGRILEDRTHPLDVWSPVQYRLDGMLRSLFEPRARLIADDTAFLLQTALKEVVQSGTAVRARSLASPSGGKTGTTDAYDAWFLGFTDREVAGVWVGSDRNRRRLGRGETGGKVALPIWKGFVEAVEEGDPSGDFLAEPPESIGFFDIDVESGLLAPPENPSLNLPFKRGTQPKELAQRAGNFDNQDVDFIEDNF